MKRKNILAITVVTLALSVAPASATTIDLSTLPLGTFVSATFGAYQLADVTGYGSGSNVFAGTNGKSVLGDNSNDGNGSGYIISRLDGGAFNLDSVTFGQSLANLGRVTLATYSNQERAVDVVVDGQTAAPGITNLTGIFIDSNALNDAGGVGISSFDVSSNAAGAVPEPATWVMMVGGFGLLGMTMRRRATAVVAA